MASAVEYSPPWYLVWIKARGFPPVRESTYPIFSFSFLFVSVSNLIFMSVCQSSQVGLPSFKKMGGSGIFSFDLVASPLLEEWLGGSELRVICWRSVRFFWSSRFFAFNVRHSSRDASIVIWSSSISAVVFWWAWWRPINMLKKLSHERLPIRVFSSFRLSGFSMFWMRSSTYWPR